jgi:hypothetical protein
MLPFGVTTLLWSPLAGHPAPEVISVQGSVKVSSPKYHAQPVGLPVDRSVNFTEREGNPDVGLAEKFATGAFCAEAAGNAKTRLQSRSTSNNFTTVFFIRFNSLIKSLR